MRPCSAGVEDAGEGTRQTHRGLAGMPRPVTVPLVDLAQIVERCAPLWQQLAGRHLLITGGTGFFGTWILSALAAANAACKLGLQVSIVSRTPAQQRARLQHLEKEMACNWIAGTAGDFACPHQPPDFILHLATATSAYAGETDAHRMLVEKLMGIRHVLEVARRSGGARLLVTSSGAVYGRPGAHLEQIPETCCTAPDPMNAASAYGNGKRLVEQFCAANADLPIVVARCFSFLGPHLPVDARFAAGNFIRDAMAGEPITVHGDGRAIRSYLYAGDLVVWLLTLLLQGKPGTAYNVGSDEAVTIAELATRIAALTGQAELRILGTPGNGPAECYVPSIDRAREHCGLRVYTDLDEAIWRTLEWHLRQRKTRFGIVTP